MRKKILEWLMVLAVFIGCLFFVAHGVIVGLLIVLFYSLVRAVVRSTRNVKTNTVTNPNVRQIPLDDRRQLEQVIHPKQSDLLQDVILVSLENQYLKNEETYRLCKDTLIDTIKQLNQQLETQGRWPSQPNQCRALSIFVAYRALFQSCSQRKEPPVFNEITFIQSIIPALSQMLGGEYWRLFEFYQILSSDLSSLKLNADIRVDLESIVYSVQLKEEKSSITPSRGTPPSSRDPSEETKPKETGEPIIDVVSDSSKPGGEGKALPNNVINTETVSTTEEASNKALSEAFLSWLEGKLSHLKGQFQINKGGLLYTQPFKHDQALFASDALWAHYHMTKNVPFDALEKALISEKIMGEKRYEVIQDDHAIGLWQLNHLSEPLPSTITVKITERLP